MTDTLLLVIPNRAPLPTATSAQTAREREGTAEKGAGYLGKEEKQTPPQIPHTRGKATRFGMTSG